MIEAIPSLLLDPFMEFGFMRRALAGCVAIGLAGAPVGAFLILRRMSLMGDAMAHAILPGAALGYLVAGLSIGAMTVGGLAAGVAVALAAGAVARLTPLKEDASLAAFYLISLAIGVLIVSTRGGTVDLMHVLFGTVLALDDTALFLLGAVASLTLLILAVIYRPLVLESFDPGFMRAVAGPGPVVHLVFLVLVVLNLVAGFHAFGTLMAVGLMILPAAAARFFTERLPVLLLLAAGLAVSAGLAGLLLSFHLGWPSGPAIILIAGSAYILAMLFGPRGGLVTARLPRRHLEA